MLKNKILSLLTAGALLVSSVAVSSLVSAEEDSLYSVYTNEAYIVDSTDCSADASDRFIFWDYDYGSRSAYENIGGDQYGVVDKVWGVSITKQKVIEPLAVGEGAVVLSFDAYTKDSNAANMSLTAGINKDVDYTTTEAYTDTRRFYVTVESNKMGLGHSSGGTSDSSINASMTALWSQGTTGFGSDGEWVHYDMVIDMVFGNTLVFCEGELILKAAQSCQTIYALQLNSRNNGYGSNQKFYMDNYTLYRVPASALKATSTAAQYKLAENRIDYAIGVPGSAGVEGTENDFWTISNGSARYKNASSEFYQGEIDCGLPPVKYGYVEAAFTGSYYPIKAFTDAYKSGEGYFTFSYDYFAGNDKSKELYLEVYQDVVPTAYNSGTRTRLLNQTGGQFGLGTTGTDTFNASAKPIKTGEWYHIDLVADMVNNKIIAYCDNEVYTEADMTLSNIYGIVFETKDRDTTSGQNNTAFYIDNFAVYWTPNPVFRVKSISVYKDGEAIEDASLIENGDALTAAVELVNNTEEDKNYMVSVAVFNGNVQSDINYIESTLTSGDKYTPVLDFEVADTTDLKIMVFVWDGMETMVPYIEEFTITK